MTGVSEATSRVLAAAQDAASDLGHGTWSTHHILLALARLGKEDRAGEVLSELGITTERLTALVLAHFPRAEGRREEPRSSLAVKEMMTHAHWLAAYMRSPDVETDHLLLALLWDQDSISAQMAAELGVSFASAYVALVGAEPPPEVLPAPSKRGDYGEPVYVTRVDMEVLLQRLHKFLPPDATYAFNFDDSRGWFWADKEVDLQRAVDEALSAD